MLHTLLSYAWVLFPILVIVFYKVVLRVFFGMVIIQENKVGQITKKFVLFGENQSLPEGKIIALKGEPGFQAQTLSQGIYWGYWFWQYDITQIDFTVIPRGQIGLIVAKDGAALPTGAILARHVDCDNFMNATEFLSKGGQKGKQVSYLNSGTYKINKLLFDVLVADLTTIEDGQIGVITCCDGIPLDTGTIAGKLIEGHNNFQDFDTFLSKGGQRGLQEQVIQAGTYSLNPWAVEIEKVAMTVIPIGNAGVVISYVGAEGVDLTGDNFKHGNIFKKGEKGVCITPLTPGKYAINPYTTRIEIVPTTNLVLNWASARTESHNLDKGLSTITVRSKDGFKFNLDVSQIIHIPAADAPKVISRFGSIAQLVSQVLEPTIGNYFRNSAQDSDVIAFLNTRSERQNAAKESISKVLEEYNVHAVDTLIGDIVPPDSLMKTLTDRKIAHEEKETFNVQQQAQEEKQKFESARALAEMQGQIVSAKQSVEIAQRAAEAEVKKSEGAAQAMQLNATAQAKALVLKAEAEAKQKEVMAKAEATQKTVNAEADARSIELNAEANAKRVKLSGEAEAFQIKATKEAEAVGIEAIGKATAESYQLAVNALGGDNFSKLKVTEAIGINKIKVIPEILISGNGDNGPLNGLMGLEMLKQMQAAPTGDTK